MNELAATLYRAFARIGSALSNEHRLRVLNLLAQREMSVDEIADRLGQSKANTSIHLKVLHQTHLIARRKTGNQVFYAMASENVMRLWMALRDAGIAELPDVRELMARFAEQPNTLSMLDSRNLLKKAASGEIVLLDLRSVEEYEAGHVPHAVSLPANELRRKLGQLPKNKTIVAYCRGPFCVSAIQSVKTLQEKGFQVFRAREGMLEWRAARRRVATGPVRLKGRPGERSRSNI